MILISLTLESAGHCGIMASRTPTALDANLDTSILGTVNEWDLSKNAPLNCGVFSTHLCVGFLVRRRIRVPQHGGFTDKSSRILLPLILPEGFLAHR